VITTFIEKSPLLMMVVGLDQRLATITVGTTFLIFVSAPYTPFDVFDLKVGIASFFLSPTDLRSE
jgi:hypothetical protein